MSISKNFRSIFQSTTYLKCYQSINYIKIFFTCATIVARISNGHAISLKQTNKKKPNQNKNQSFHAELQNKAVVSQKGCIINTCGAFDFLQKNPPKPGSGHFFEDSATFSSRLHLLPEKSHDTHVRACQQSFPSQPVGLESFPREPHCLHVWCRSEDRTGRPATMTSPRSQTQRLKPLPNRANTLIYPSEVSPDHTATSTWYLKVKLCYFCLVHLSRGTTFLKFRTRLIMELTIPKTIQLCLWVALWG